MRSTQGYEKNFWQGEEVSSNSLPYDSLISVSAWAYGFPSSSPIMRFGINLMAQIVLFSERE